MNNIQETTNKNTMEDTLKCDQRKEKSYNIIFYLHSYKSGEEKKNKMK